MIEWTPVTVTGAIVILIAVVAIFVYNIRRELK